MEQIIATLIECLPNRINSLEGTYLINNKKITLITQDGLILSCDSFFNATQSNEVVKLLKRLCKEQKKKVEQGSQND